MRRSKLGKPGTGSVVLSALGLSPATIQEHTGTGVVVGAILNKSVGSTLSLTVDGGGRFAISGTNIVTTSTQTDYATATFHSITIRETLAGAVGTPRDTTLSITVTAIPVTLGALAFSPSLTGSPLVNGTLASGTITGATAGSTLVLSGSIPTGLTIDSTARTWAFDGTGSASSGTFSIVETLAGAINTPRSTSINYTINAASGGGNTTLAPTLGYPSPLAGPATSIVIGLPMDWVENDTLVFAYSASSTMSSPTLLTHVITATDITNGTISLPLPGVTGLKYYQAYNRRAGVDSSNKSNVVSSGDTTAPTITTASTANVTETFALAISLTGTDTGGIASWSIAGGADQLQFEISGTTLRWISNGTQSFSSPADQGINNVYDVIVRATDYGGNYTDQAIAVTVQVADISPTAFTFTDVSSANLSQAYTSNTITISGLTSGVNAPVSVTGGTWSKNGGTFSSSAGTVQNGDTIAVQATSSASYEANVDVVLTVGTGPAVSDTYTIATMPDPANIVVTAGSITSTYSSTSGSIKTMTLNFPTTGEHIILLYCNNAKIDTSVAVAGEGSATLDNSNHGTAVANYFSMWRINIAASGNKVVTLTSSGFPSRITGATVSVAATTAASSASGTQLNSFTSNPHLCPSLTVPSHGVQLGIVRNDLHGACNGTTSEMLYDLNGSSEGISIIKNRNTGQMSYSDGGVNFWCAQVAAWG